MDPIISKLNEIAQGKVETSLKLPDIRHQSTDFQSTLDNSVTDRLLSKLKEDYGLSNQNGMNVLNADSIHVETKGVEAADAGKPFSASDEFFDMFKGLNKDLMGLDSAIETLTTPGLKFSPQQLLALQAGVANTTILAEGFTRLVDVTGRFVQTIQNVQA